MIINILGKFFFFKDFEGLVIFVIYRIFEKGMFGLFYLIDVDIKSLFSS